jgi:hypothetical protein
MPQFDPHVLSTGQQATARALQDRNALVAALAQQTGQIAALEARARSLEQAGQAAPLAALRAQLATARAQRADQQKQLQQIDASWVHALKDFHVHVDPCDADPARPLLLLPVRVETRYTDDRRTLRVRIFPDEIHIDHLDRGLSAAEQTAGRAYWAAVWQKPDGDPALDDAWRALGKAVGLARASWVATALTPLNLGQAGAPHFPEAGAPLRRAAVVRLLPDRFVAVAWQGDQRSDATGALVNPELVIGLLADDGSERINVNGVPVPAGAEWVVDYNRAVAAGMAINLPLKRPGAKIDRLFVFGTRASLDVAQTAKELESLLTAHRCTRGLAFLPQGTPTNNTESDRSAWQQRPQPTPPARGAPAPDSNAAVLATALGLGARTFAGLDHGDLAEQAAAHAMNVALWGPTWGGFLDKVTVVNRSGATLSDTRREETRTFFRDSVRGRGPLPALRVGQQPYGILPVSALAEKRWHTPGNDGFESALLPLLRRVRALWTWCLANVPRVHNGVPLDQALRDILGASPVSQGLRVRAVLSGEAVETGAKVSGAVTDAQAVERIIEQLVLEEVVLNASFIHPAGSLAKDSRPLALPLVDDSDPAFIDALLAGGSPKVASVLQALLTLSWDAAARAVAAAAPRERILNVIDLATALPAATRARAVAMSGAAATASVLSLHTLANEIVATTGEAGFSRLAEHQPAQSLRTSLGQLALESTSAAARDVLAGFALAAWYRELAKQAELREALKQLKALSRDARRILLAETLDLSSHRLDAWLTGVVERSRAAQRAANPTGLSVGAYGWVEDIIPGQGSKPDGGYVHAPSLAHAATVGILRSAYLSHNPDRGGSGAFAIDLSSARVRTALELIDGVRQGQQLPALVGYRIERRLHEARLDRLTLSLRSLAPLVARRLTDRGQVDGAQAQEAVAANNVVDGIALIELLRKDPSLVRNTLNSPPKNNPYIKPADWPGLTVPEWNAVQAIIAEAAAAADAAADLLLAESVHQLVQGNMSGAAASLDALGGGDAPPPEPDVIRTPARGAPFTHRIVLAVPAAGAAGAAGWSAARPRAQAEPRLEQWAQARLGNATSIVVSVAASGTRTTLDAAGLCALDVIYDSDDPSRLEQRVRAAIPALAPAQPLAGRTDRAWPAGSLALGDVMTYAASLRALLVNAQPARPADFVNAPPAREGDFNLPSEPPPRGFSSAEISAAWARVTAARGGLQAHRDQLALALAHYDEANPAGAVPLRKALEDVAAYGVVTPIAADEHLRAVAQMAADEATHRLAQAAALTGTPDENKVAQAGAALFGDGFWVLPALTPPATPDLLSVALSAAPTTHPPPRAEIRRFVRDTATVRVAVGRFSEALLLADAVGRPTPLRVAQLVAPGTAGAASWVGGALDPAQPTPDAPITNLVFDAPPALDPAAPMTALVIDGWADVVPVRERRGANPNDPIDERRVSGVAVNAPAAAARPPQALLLAISPDGARWTTDALLETLTETLELAKLRTVTLEHTLGAARVLPAAYEQSYSLQGEKVLDLRAVAQVRALDALLKYVKE